MTLFLWTGLVLGVTGSAVIALRAGYYDWCPEELVSAIGLTCLAAAIWPIVLVFAVFCLPLYGLWRLGRSLRKR